MDTITLALHRLASRARHSALLRPLEGIFRRIEPAWNAALGRAVSDSGFPTHVNNDLFQLTYAYGSRYDKRRIYEPDIYLPYAASIHPGMTVVDIGAHVGFFTLAAAQRVGPTGKVISFEPSPDTLVLLRQHVQLNRWTDRVVIEPCVVSDQPGNVSFFTFRDTMAASLSRENVEVLSAQQVDHAIEVTVQAVTLDAYCAAQHLQPDVIKIDVEGAELRVLRGARQLLTTRPCTVWCEIHPLQMSKLGDGVEQFQEYISEIGYACEPIASPGHMGIFPSLIKRRT